MTNIIFLKKLIKGGEIWAGALKVPGNGHDLEMVTVGLRHRDVVEERVVPGVGEGEELLGILFGPAVDRRSCVSLDAFVLWLRIQVILNLGTSIKRRYFVWNSNNGTI
jgi:hypothetical protein